MKTSRNDPCPCGSGKKYKACCMGRDQARAHARSVIGEEAFDEAEAEWLALAREEKVWAAEIAPATGQVRDAPDGMSIVMVMAGEWVAHTEVLAHRPAGAAERARDLTAAVNAAARVLGVLPERLKVPDDELVEPVARALEGRGVAVLKGDSEDLFHAMNAALAHMDPSPARGRMTVALTWRETEASAEELKEFHEAAAAFFTAAPWTLEDEDFVLDLPPDPNEIPIPGFDMPERRQWAASVMGSLGESFGLMLLSQVSDLESFYASDSPASVLTPEIGFSLTVDFDRKSELTRTMQREVAAARWPIAAPHAYPRLFGLGLPGRWIHAYEVRVATLALRAITAVARGGDPLAEAGVGVAPFDPTESEDENRLDWFHVPEQASPVRAEGSGADAEPGSTTWNASVAAFEALKAAEEERVGGFADWLRAQGVADEDAQADLENANAWKWTLIAAGSPAAVTEFDLRLFLYKYYIGKSDPTPEAVRALPRSMRRIVQWLEEREGVRYPFAAAVLDELDQIVERANDLGEPLDETLHILSYDVYDDLDARVMLPASRGWPELMSLEVAQLREELQRRWLAWYDELVRGGTTGYDELENALLARQRGWENTPHPRVGGRTPVEVIVEYVNSRG